LYIATQATTNKIPCDFCLSVTTNESKLARKAMACEVSLYTLGKAIDIRLLTIADNVHKAALVCKWEVLATIRIQFCAY
jgi:hypothetical protein